jgi:hypothetical protein
MCEIPRTPQNLASSGILNALETAEVIGDRMGFAAENWQPMK